MSALTHSRPPTDPDPVQEYLARRPWLAPLEAETRRQIDRLFGADARVRLEVVRDEDGGEQLFAIVASALPIEDALAALGRLDEEWLFDAPTRGQFNVDIEAEVGQDAV